MIVTVSVETDEITADFYSLDVTSKHGAFAGTIAVDF
jgi:hypothetical protein